MTLSGEKATAFHEAGHAVYAYLLGVRIKKASIVSDGVAAGKVLHHRIIRGLGTGEQFQKDIALCLAGPIAQRIHNPRSCRTAQFRGDYDEAVGAAFKAGGSTQQVNALLRYLKICVEDRLHLRPNWFLVERLAGELLRRKQMSGEEIRVYLTECGTSFASQMKNETRG